MLMLEKLQAKYMCDENLPPQSRLFFDWGIGDVGGQKTLRSYWRNYFEKTDTLIWVVDSTDRLRIDDCRKELAGLLLEEVRHEKKGPKFNIIADTIVTQSA